MTADLFKFAVIEDSLRIAFNGYVKACINELLCRRWRQCRPVLGSFGFTTKPEWLCRRHCIGLRNAIWGVGEGRGSNVKKDVQSGER